MRFGPHLPSPERKDDLSLLRLQARPAPAMSQVRQDGGALSRVGHGEAIGGNRRALPRQRGAADGQRQHAPARQSWPSFERLPPRPHRYPGGHANDRQRLGFSQCHAGRSGQRRHGFAYPGLSLGRADVSTVIASVGTSGPWAAGRASARADFQSGSALRLPGGPA